MSQRIPRREALRHLAVLSLSTLAPASLLGCSKKLTCTDESGLTPDQVNQRNNIAAYVDHSPKPAELCSNCIHYEPAAPKQCGGCKVVAGPIHPDGWCKLWVAKPS